MDSAPREKGKTMSLQTKRFLKNEVNRLSYRVAELEERLCPCESHDWKRVGVRYAHIAMGEVQTVYRLKCKVCGKERESWEW